MANHTHLIRSTLATGTELLMDISYRVVGIDPEQPDVLLIEVIGDTSEVPQEVEGLAACV